jgi:hypothetical protein
MQVSLSAHRLRLVALAAVTILISTAAFAASAVVQKAYSLTVVPTPIPDGKIKLEIATTIPGTVDVMASTWRVRRAVIATSVLMPG